MSFQVSFPGLIRNRLLRLKEKVKAAGRSKELGRILGNIQECLAERPLELGEIQYTLKHVQMPVCLLVREYLAVDYAVNAAGGKVFVTKLKMLEDHPFPAGFEKILND